MISVRSIATLLLTLVSLAAALPAQAQSPAPQDAPPPHAPRDTGELPDAFHDQIDLSSFALIAVHTDGRIKSFESHANLLMQSAVGPRRLSDSKGTRSHAFTYLDLMLRPREYGAADVVFVRNKNVRAQIRRVLEYTLEEDRLDRFMRTGRLAPAWIDSRPVRDLLRVLERDIIRTKKEVDRISTARVLIDPAVLQQELRVVPMPGGDFHDPWMTIEDFARMSVGSDHIASLQVDIVREWNRLRLAWIDQHAQTVNEATARLAGLLAQVNTEIYPSQNRLWWEGWYFRANNMTWVWMIYLLSIVFLLMAIIYRWKTAAWLGIGIFTIAFILHTFAVMLRWYVADRWPNSNMFEAVTTSAWMSAVGAYILEAWVRKTSLRNVFFLGSAATCMVAMMAAYFLPLYLDPNISNMMPVLHDIWLYIHTNVIIFAYVLIFMAAISAMLYIGYRILGGPADYAKAGGAESMIVQTRDGGTYFQQPKVTAGQVFDGATMVLVELSFVLLWAGTVMGAIWADHSWGRPWGWDPKEVFALNTFIVFVILIHARLKARDKGMWTAMLALLGAAVMLFNWIVINFYISGLHSYA